jgi:hypothetical protein
VISPTCRKGRAEAHERRRAEAEKRRLERKWALLGADVDAVMLLHSATDGWPSPGVVALRDEIESGIVWFPQ